MKYDFKLLSRVLEQLPVNIFFKDTECRYVFASHYWRHIKHGNKEEWSIAGKTDLEIRVDKNTKKKWKKNERIEFL